MRFNCKQFINMKKELFIKYMKPMNEGQSKYTKTMWLFIIWFSKKKLTNVLSYAVKLLLFVFKVFFQLIRRYFCYPILKTTYFVTTAHGNVQNKTSKVHVQLIEIPNRYTTLISCFSPYNYKSTWCLIFFSICSRITS